ncbi:MAG: Plug domain-containing protein [Alistipes sp.]|nr:Plug domain-containing protein [Alistipes sp.]
MKRPIALLLALAAALGAAAQRPLYIVNGVERDDIASIPPADIERVEELPADDETVARYGQRASHGVVVVTLRYDTPARFGDGSETFDECIARSIRWDADETAARVVVRYVVGPDGAVTAGEVLQSTDNRLRRRVLKALAEAPRWQPATKDGEAIASEGVLRIQLPEGKRLPRHAELVWR